MIPISNVRKPLLLFATAIILTLVGCTVRVADLTLVSTKNVDLTATHLDARNGTRVTGDDCAVSLLGLLPLGVPNLQGAVDDALEKGNGNILVDEVTYVKGYYFVLFSQSCIEVEGTVLNISKT